MNWFKRHRVWTSVLISLLVVVIVGSVMKNADVVWLWGFFFVLYLIAWLIWGRKRRW